MRSRYHFPQTLVGTPFCLDLNMISQIEQLGFALISCLDRVFMSLK